MKLLLFLTILAGAAIAQQPPLYRAGRTLDAVTIDGRADELTWTAYEGVGSFTNIRGGAVADTTRAVVAWDDENFYVLFACVDEQAWGTLEQRDDAIWNEEVVEVFLDPDGDSKDYAELEISPHNVVVDLMVPAPGAGGAEDWKKWDIEGLQTAVQVQEGAGWTVEIAIPWASLGRAGVTEAPGLGERWRVGLYRIERPGGAQEPEMGRRFLAWSPTERSFHEPSRFGVIEFALRP